jgi:polar amino acid transport system permease protein
VSSTVVNRPDATRRRAGLVPTHRGFAIASLLFPPIGVPALLSSLKTGRLARSSDTIRAARRQSARTVDLCWYAIGVGLGVYFVGFLVLVFTANDGSVQDTFLPGDVLSDGELWSSLFKGFRTNVSLALLAQFFILIWALVIAILRLLPGKACAPIRWVVIAYSDLFRGLPGILVVLIINFGLPQADLPLLRGWSPFQYSCLALVLLYGAYVAEVYRAGIQSVHPSQVSAARSLGLSYTQTLREVVVPQAVRRVIPPLLNDFIALQKDTAILAFVGVNEVVNRARFYNNARVTLAAYTGAALIFFVFTIPQTRFVDWLIARQQNAQFGRK